MSKRKELLISKMDEQGIIMDLPAVELPPNAFSSGANINFRNGSVKTAKGYAKLDSYPGDDYPTFIMPYEIGEQYFYIVAGQNEIYSWNGNDWVNITSVAPTGTYDDKWSGMVAGNIVCLTNGIDPPFYWDQPTAGGKLEDLLWDNLDEEGSPPEPFETSWRDEDVRCEAMRSHKGLWIALNITEDYTGSGIKYPHRVMWSSATPALEIPFSWDYSNPTILAGYLDLLSTGGYVVDGIETKDSFLVFKDSSTYALDYTGDEFVFSDRLISRTTGLLAKNCAANVQDSVVFITDDDIVATDGNDITSIINRQIRREFFKNISLDNYRRAFVTHYSSEKEVWFCLPAANDQSANVAAVWNYGSGNTWTLKEMPETSHITAGIYIKPAENDEWDNGPDVVWEENARNWTGEEYDSISDALIGLVPAVGESPEDKRILSFDVTNTFEGAPRTSFIERTDLALSGEQTVVAILGVIPRISGSGEVKITVGSQQFEGAPVKWGTPKTYDIGKDRQVSARVSGSLFAYRIESIGNYTWICSGLTILYEDRGER